MEKVALIPEEDFLRTHERFCQAAQFFNNAEENHESLLQIKGIVSPRNAVSQFGIVTERFEAVSLENLVGTNEGRLETGLDS
jgi:hypothetical protein